MSRIAGCRRLIARYVWRRRINHIALIVILLSVASLFTVNAVLRGFESEMIEMLRGSRSDLKLRFPAGAPRLSELEEKLHSHTWSPAIDGFGLLRTDHFIMAVSLKGVDARREKSLRLAMGMDGLGLEALGMDTAKTSTPELLSLFGATDDDEPEPMLIGHLMADDLGLAVGDRVQLQLPDWSGGIGSGRFEIVGLFRTGLYEEDRSKVLIDMEVASRLLKHPDGYTQVQFAAPAEELESTQAGLTRLWPGAVVQRWYEEEPVALRALRNQRIITDLIVLLVLLVAGFGIFAIQSNFVREKTADIGVLRAMGFGVREIFSIFLGVSLSIGLLGTALGFAGGFALCLNINELIAWSGIDPFPGDLYYHDGIPVDLRKFDIFWIGLSSLTLTCLAGGWPAWQAARVEPAEAIRAD